MGGHADDGGGTGASANRERVAIEIERLMAASPPELFGAWTRRFDEWFASPGEIAMDAREGAPFWFDVVFEGEHHAHYGRFLRLVENELLTLTWVTGHGGTEGAETTVRVELAPRPAGTLLRLTHSGFYDESSAKRHEDSWPTVLAHLDEWLSPSR